MVKAPSNMSNPLAFTPHLNLRVLPPTALASTDAMSYPSAKRRQYSACINALEAGCLRVHEEIGDGSQRSHWELSSSGFCVRRGRYILGCQNLTDGIYASSPATVRVNERNDARQGK